MKKIVSFLIIFSFILQQIGFAQVGSQLDISGLVSSTVSKALVEKYRPVHLRSMSFDATAEGMRLLLDKGDNGNKSEVEIEEETKELVRYFFIGLSIPNEEFWVNLRPNAKESVLEETVSKTEIGKILLETDIQLKKDVARYTNPTSYQGKEYWNKLYKKAEELYASSKVTIPTLTRPWIVPNEIIVRESKEGAYVYKATLKVMLEEDYLKGSDKYSFKTSEEKQLNEYAAKLIREEIIPQLTKEINSSKRYAKLRQVYYSLILAQWYKEKYKNTTHSYAKLIDQKDLKNLESKEKWNKESYFKEYEKSFKEGEYNLQENVITSNGQCLRSYLSGGISFVQISNVLKNFLPTIKFENFDIYGKLQYIKSYLVKTDLEKLSIKITEGAFQYKGLSADITPPKSLQAPGNASLDIPDGGGGKKSYLTGRYSLPKAIAIKQINEFVAAVKNEPYRNGVILDLNQVSKSKEVILVGDLHARMDNLKKILNFRDNYKKIKSGELILVFLGDMIHDAKNLEEMDSSIEILQFIMELKIQNPENVFCLLGNHDYWSEEISKDGVDQGRLFKLAVLKEYGADYAKSYIDFVNSSSIMVTGDGFVGLHAGPIKYFTLEEIAKTKVSNFNKIDSMDEEILLQANWDRYKVDYNNKDIRDFLVLAGQPRGKLILAHNPQDAQGWHWKMSSNMYIIVAQNDDSGYASIEEGEVKFFNTSYSSANFELKREDGGGDLKIPSDAFNALNSVDYNVFEKNVKELAINNLLQLDQSKYFKILKRISGKIKEKYSKMGQIVFNPAGGADVFSFRLNNEITDVISFSQDAFGLAENVFAKRTEFVNPEYFDLGFDSSIRLEQLNGIGIAAVERIVAGLDAKITGVYYFEINNNGNFKFLSEKVIKNPVICKNAVIEFEDPRNSGITKRFWCIQQDINEENLAFSNFIKKVKFDILLLKSCFDMFGFNSIFFNKHKVFEKIILPAKRNNALVITDQQFDLNEVNQNYSYKIWNSRPDEVDLFKDEFFGYSYYQRESEFYNKVYFGLADALINSIAESEVYDYKNEMSQTINSFNVNLEKTKNGNFMFSVKENGGIIEPLTKNNFLKWQSKLLDKIPVEIAYKYKGIPWEILSFLVDEMTKNSWDSIESYYDDEWIGSKNIKREANYQGHIQIEFNIIDDYKGKKLLVRCIDNGLGKNAKQTKEKQKTELTMGGFGKGTAVLQKVAQDIGGSFSIDFDKANGAVAEFAVPLDWLRFKQKRIYRREDLINLKKYYEFLKSVGQLYDFTEAKSRLHWLGRLLPHLATNEKWESHWDVIKNLPNDGAYIGTRAGGQNFSRLVTGKFSLGVMVDKNPYVAMVYLPLNMSLISIARSRIEYFSLLTGIEFSDLEMYGLEDNSQDNHFVPVKDIKDALLKKILLYYDEARDLQVLQKNRKNNINQTWKIIQSNFAKEFWHRPAVKEFWEIFAATSMDTNPARFLKRLNSMLTVLSRGESWLSSDKEFLRIKQMIEQDKIFGVVGDLMQPQIVENINVQLKARALKATAIYISNIPERNQSPQEAETQDTKLKILSKFNAILHDVSCIILQAKKKETKNTDSTVYELEIIEVDGGKISNYSTQINFMDNFDILNPQIVKQNKLSYKVQREKIAREFPWRIKKELLTLGSGDSYAGFNMSFYISELLDNAYDGIIYKMRNIDKNFIPEIKISYKIIEIEKDIKGLEIMISNNGFFDTEEKIHSEKYKMSFDFETPYEGGQGVFRKMTEKMLSNINKKLFNNRQIANYPAIIRTGNNQGVIAKLILPLEIFDLNDADGGNSKKVLGGVDLRKLSFKSEGVVKADNLLSKAGVVNYEKYVQEIDSFNKLVGVNILPASNKISLFIDNSYDSGYLQKDTQKVLLCVADILRLQEEKSINIDSNFKNAISRLELAVNN